MEDENLDHLLKEKESEIRELHYLKLRTLENKIIEKENVIQLLELKNKELQNDFEYNLSIIEERDSDIQDLTQNMLKLKDILEKKQIQFSEFQDQIEELNSELAAEKSKFKVREKALMEKIDDLKHEVKSLKEEQMGEYSRSKIEYEKQIKILQKMVVEKDEIVSRFEEEKHSLSSGLINDQKRLEESLTSQIKHLKAQKEDEIKGLNKKLSELLQENQTLRDQNLLNSKSFLEKSQEEGNKISELKAQNKQLERSNLEITKEIEELRRSSNSWNSIIQEKFDNLKFEKEQLEEKLLQQKNKYKNKIKMIKDLSEKKVEDIAREHNYRSRKYDEDIKSISYERDQLHINEKILREKVQELEFKIQKDVRMTEERSNQLQKNLEQDLKKLRNELDLKDHQLSRIKEEKLEVENKIADFTHQNQELEEKINALEKENKLLFEEITDFRAELPDQRNTKKQLAAEEKRKSPQKILKLEEAPVDESYEQLFSEDLGPVSPMNSVDILKSGLTQFKFGKNMKNDSNLLKSYIQQIEILQRENEDLKDLVEKMKLDMENVKLSIQLKNQQIDIKNEEILGLRNRISHYEHDNLEIKRNLIDVENSRNQAEFKVKELTSLNRNYEAKISEIQEKAKKYDEYEPELGGLKLKILQLKNENEKLKSEREELIEISNSLRSRINRLEDSHSPNKENEDNNIIKSLKEEVKQKITVIEKLKKYLPPSYRIDISNDPDLREFLPERDLKNPDGINDEFPRASIERFKTKIEDLRNEFHIETNKKPLVEPKAHYTPNSLKATASQKEVEQRLKSKKKTPQKIRNYNQRDDE